VLQNQPAGAALTLREFATKMISISDNTATDHLIDLVGRSTVESAQLETRHSDPSSNVPWLYTRELFALKVWASSSQVEAYRNASVAEKRGLLDQLRGLPLELDKLTAWSAPRMLDLEWFASALDLCQVMAALGSRAQLDPNGELLRLLALNPGVAFDPAQWSYVGYKGGSEPGVLNMSWLLRRVDGRWFSLVVTLNDSARPIDEAAAVQVARDLAQLLGAAQE
jgi:beta-lactamase class A